MLSLNLFLFYKIDYQGDSKDCRIRVKRLNELKSQTELKSDQRALAVKEISSNEVEHRDETVVYQPSRKVSKWAKFLTKSDDE